MGILDDIILAKTQRKKLLAVLIDPDGFPEKEEIYAFAKAYLKKIPHQTTHILIGGSTDAHHKTENTVQAIKAQTELPVVLFPGNYEQITAAADGILYLSLISGRNPEYLVAQQVKGALATQNSGLEVIPTGYLLIDGGKETAVQRISNTSPIPQDDIKMITATALAGALMGKKCIYLEAGSGARFPVNEQVISAVRELIDIPLIVGGGIRSQKMLDNAYDAGADMVVIGTAFEEGTWNTDDS